MINFFLKTKNANIYTLQQHFVFCFKTCRLVINIVIFYLLFNYLFL